MTADEDLFVKICGITTEADALLAVGLGADAVGFVFAPSPRQVAAATVGDIVKRLPLDILTVGVFRNEAPSRVVEIANHIGLGAVQLHGHESAEDCRWIRSRVACVIKAFSAGDRTIGRFKEFGADYLLVDGPSPGSGEVFDWRLAEGVVDPGRLIVSGGLTAENVGQAISHLRPYGVDVSTGVESEPGRKDPQLVGAFISAARAAHWALSGDGGGADVAPGVLGNGVGAGARGRSNGASRWGGEAEDPAEAADGPYDWMEG
jgi:phosphoribosylanthranilate isomerase